MLTNSAFPCASAFQAWIVKRRRNQSQITSKNLSVGVLCQVDETRCSKILINLGKMFKLCPGKRIVRQCWLLIQFPQHRVTLELWSINALNQLDSSIVSLQTHHIRNRMVKQEHFPNYLVTWSIGVTLAVIWSSGIRIGSPAKTNGSIYGNFPQT